MHLLFVAGLHINMDKLIWGIRLTKCYQSNPLRRVSRILFQSNTLVFTAAGHALFIFILELSHIQSR